ncbi:MAG: hypothetical protein DYH05_03570 [Acidobacteria bacterium ACB1]|nr:hypothetical protein [Acidobacteria bacterium ACB1]
MYLSRIFHVDSNAKNAKAFRKVHKDAAARLFFFAYSAGFASRASLCDLCVFCQPKMHRRVFLLSALISTQSPQSETTQSSLKNCNML